MKADMVELDSTLGKSAVAAKAAWAAMGAGIVLAGADAIKSAANFDAAMERIHTQAGASQQEVNRLKNAILDLAPAVGIAPDKLAAGLYHIESAGFRGAQAMAMLKAAAEGAAIGNANLEDVTQAMIATMASGIKGVNGASDAMALLNTTVGIGDMTMEQLAQAMATGLLPSARSAGLGMNDVAAALATITDNATPADEAATRLRMTFALMSSPTKKATDALATIGMTATSLATDMRKPDGLLTAVLDLKAHLEAAGLSAVEQNQVIEHAFGGGRTSGAILTLIEESGRLKTKYEELGTSASRAAQFQDDWSHTQATFIQQLHDLTATLDVAAIEVGHVLVYALEDMIHVGEDVVSFFEHNQLAAAALASVLAASLVPGLIETGVWLGRVVALNAGAMFMVLRAAVAGAGEAFVAAGGGIRGMGAALESLNINPMMLGLTAVATAATYAWMQQREAADAARQAADNWVTHLGASTASLTSTENAINAINGRLKQNMQLLEWMDSHGRSDADYKAAVAAGNELQSQRDKLMAQAATMRSNETELGHAYGLTGVEVEQLANRYGIDLSGALSVVGPKFDEAVAAIRLSHHPMQQAEQDMASLGSKASSTADDIKALDEAWADLVGNFIGAQQATLDAKNDLVALDQALKKSHGSLSLNTQAGP